MMTALFVALAMGQISEDRPPHPLAPSLPTPTKAEIAAYRKVVDRLIDVEVGNGSPTAIKEATRAVELLPPESIFVLVDRFNFAADNEHSCPCVVLGRKIAQIVGRTNDLDLVSYVKENIGAGVSAKRHRGTLKDLQVACVIRRGQIGAQAMAFKSGAERSPASMTNAELSGFAAKLPPAKLPMLLAEAAKRKDPVKLDVLGVAAERTEKDVQTLARGMIRKETDAAKDAELRKLLTHSRAEVRKAAVASAEARGIAWGEPIIDRLNDDDAGVRRAAFDALVRFNRGTAVAAWDDSSPGYRVQAAERWRAWLKKPD